MASKEYSFSLPKHQSAKALGMIYLLPTVADARISLTLITATKTRDYSVTVPVSLVYITVDLVYYKVKKFFQTSVYTKIAHFYFC